jgi:hypothetical protein
MREKRERKKEKRNNKLTYKQSIFVNTRQITKNRATLYISLLMLHRYQFHNNLHK